MLAAPILDTLREIILDSQDTPLDTGTTRRLAITVTPNRATVCIGARRSGKSTYMTQIIDKHLSEGVQRQNILFINFFDDRLHRLRYEGLDVVLEAYFSLFPEKKNSETVYCFFDEIQVIEGWEPFIDRLMRTQRCEVYITGSSAQLLSKEIATQMRGRASSWEVFPFSFQEFLDAKDIEHAGHLSAKKRLLIEKAFRDFWETGAFPEVTSLQKPMRRKIHQEYFNTMLFRDLVERHDVSHPKAVSDLAHWLVDNVGCLYSVNKLTAYLKSLGHSVPKASVSNYLAWLEDAYFFFSLRIFDASLKRANANPKKIYCIDHALVTSCSSGILVNDGHLLENLVFIAVRRLSADIFYVRTNSGKEVDFLVQQNDGTRMLIQVCESLAGDATRRREIAALDEAMSETNCATGIIVTRQESEHITVNNGVVRVIPAWLFLLEMARQETTVQA